MLLCIIMAEVLANFIITEKRIKGIQIGNQEIKIVDFADDKIIFLRDINCLNRIQSILKLYEDASSSKINFTKSQALWAGDYKNRFDKPGDMVWSNLYIIILGINFVNFTLENSVWDKISENITKKIHLWNRIRLSLRSRKLVKNQILLSKLWYKGQLYTIPKYIKTENERRIYDFL